MKKGVKEKVKRKEKKKIGRKLEIDKRKKRVTFAC